MHHSKAFAVILKGVFLLVIGVVLHGLLDYEQGGRVDCWWVQGRQAE
jgi:hypothetical protein